MLIYTCHFSADIFNDFISNNYSTCRQSMMSERTFIIIYKIFKIFSNIQMSLLLVFTCVCMNKLDSDNLHYNPIIKNTDH